jgi:hypothetical protein
LRVSRARPDLAPGIGRISGLYLQLRYLAEPDRVTQRALDAEVARLRP